ncbi:hypothetical protein [Streptomyces erythrochromogenes]|uniref:hypothetical protein n=1 Tax=Streptomyces erythrochromogenes TaxID=285574 RepID=UPI0022586751|nr:hypothetical protein [Streptomyces erythrochromogenes]MCX5587574.1 hypothetical protein [Streptomyces erythrochromogenes]
MHRPYPNAGRALRQLARHHVPEPTQPSEFTLKLARQANAALAAAHQSLRPFREMVERLQAQPCRPNAAYDPQSGQFVLLDS